MPMITDEAKEKQGEDSHIAEIEEIRPREKKLERNRTTGI